MSLPALAHADESTGTWTGSVELRGNYYWERSTLVVSPETTVNVRSPSGARVSGHYLVDSITSASVAAGVLVDVRFVETRHQGGLGAGYEFDLGDARLDVGVSTNVSSEPDYLSLGAGTTAALSLADRATVLRLGAFYLRDEVGKILRGGADRSDPTGRDLSNRGVQGTLDALVLSAGWDQVLAPTLTASVGYDLGINDGFQSNAYRNVSVDGSPQPETHPDFRLRHTLHGRLAWNVGATNTTLALLYRAYLDSWDVAAITPEVRVYQRLEDTLTLRLRYRYYEQTRSFFYDTQYTGSPRYFTADPKMSAFHSHLLGAQLAIDMAFLDETFLEFARDASVDVSFEHVMSTSRFGDGVIAQAGITVPF